MLAVACTTLLPYVTETSSPQAAAILEQSNYSQHGLPCGWVGECVGGFVFVGGRVHSCDSIKVLSWVHRGVSVYCFVFSFLREEFICM